VFLSHKLAGPVYRFEKSTQIVSGGDLTYRVRLRKGDELMELQDNFNRMTACLQDRVAKDRNLAERLARQIDELAQNKSLPADAVTRLREMKTELEHITREFKI
jgi:nitrogen fixation/metabolism regulation signal transduction histidine kinase